MLLLGWLLTGTGFLTSRALREINRLTYWVGLPALLVSRIGNTEPAAGAAAGLIAVTLGATLLAMAASLAVALLLRLPAEARGTFVQGVFRGNLVFVGLPVVVYAFASEASGATGAESSALLAIAPAVVVYNVAAVVVLLLSAAARRDSLIKPVFYGLTTNPILIGCVIGLGFSLAPLTLPAVATRTLAAVGQMALPLALLCIGGTLWSARLRGRLGPALAGALMKTAALPAIGWLLAGAIGLSLPHTRIALLLLACPTATASYVLVRQLGGDASLASSIILMSTALAIPAMAVILAVTK